MTEEETIEWMEAVGLYDKYDQLIEDRVAAEMQDYINLQETMCRLISYITDGKLF